MSKDLLLMCEDNIVMRINVDESKYEVINEKLLPFAIKGRIRKPMDYRDVKTKYEDTQRQLVIKRNSEAVETFFDFRVLPLNRENAKWIFNAFNFPQDNTKSTRLKIILACRGVSLSDSYWLKIDGESLQWKDKNLRHNSLNDIVGQIALHGTKVTLQGKIETPELTTHGAYAKAWKRENGELWLYKRGYNGTTESKIEVMVSKLLDNCNVNHVEYLPAEDRGIFMCKCKCMSDDKMSIVSGGEFISYCNAMGKDWYKELLTIDADSVYKMMIVDYLISNPDRHGMNWGLYYKTDTTEIVGCHPLYDHNNAFDLDVMRDDDFKSIFISNATMRECAVNAMKNVDFHFYREFTRDDFLTERQFKSFTNRARYLGIQVKEGYKSAIDVLTKASKASEV